jgi:hypothetical protein
MTGASRSLPWIRHGAVIGLVLWSVVLAGVFLGRIAFPLELEWMEGGVLHQARRFQLGESIYPEPSIDFVPFLYTPLYPIVLAVLGFLFPLGFLLARVVSVAATVAVALGVWHAVRGEDRPKPHAALAVALFLSSYVFTFRWLDVGRPDSLYMALVLWGLVILRRSSLHAHVGLARRQAIVAGLLVALAFWTKQTAATFVIAGGIGALLVAPRRLVPFAATIAIVDGGGVLLGNALTDGRLWTYIYELHQLHAFNRERFTTKTWGMFAHAAPFLVLLVAMRVGLALDGARRRRGVAPKAREPVAWRGLAYWWLLFATGLVVSALGYSTQWAEPNAFLPGVVMGAIAIAIALPVGGRAEALLLGLGLAQLAFSLAVEPMYQPIQDRGARALARSYAWQDPARTIPSVEDRARARAMRDEIEATEGELLALHRPWWSVLAGGQGHVGSMGINDVPDDAKTRLQSDVRASIRARRWAAIRLEGEPPAWMLGDLRHAGYRMAARWHGEARVRPWSGWMSVAGVVTPYEADQVLLVRDDLPPAPERALLVVDHEDGTAAAWSFTGTAFGGRPVANGPLGKLPWPAGAGGRFLLSSAGRRGDLRATGTAETGAFEIHEADLLHLRVGFAGTADGLRAELRAADGSPGGDTVAFALPGKPDTLEPIAWVVPSSWHGQRVRLVLVDEAHDGAILVDDVWLGRSED